MEDLQVAASELLDAFKQNDSAALATALKNFIVICESQGHDGESPDGDGYAYGGEVGNSGQEGNFGFSEQRAQSKYFGEKY